MNPCCAPGFLHHCVTASLRHPFAALVAAACLSAATPGAAQEPRSALVELASHAGPDREQRLLDGARREGILNLYTSLTVDDMTALNAAFEQKTGVKVRMWRASSEKVVQRAIAEARAGRFDVDVIECNAPALEILHREGLLQAVRSQRRIDPHRLQPRGVWRTHQIRERQVAQACEGCRISAAQDQVTIHGPSSGRRLPSPPGS